MAKAPFRRIVPGHNGDGNALILEGGPPPRVAKIGEEIAPRPLLRN